MSERGTAPLSVQTLGSFAVWRGAERLPDTAWSREKAAQVFQYFVTFPRLTDKERIAEDLWTTLDADQADRDFKVAMNALNDALEPERPARTNAVYLTRQGSSYGLSSEAEIELDFVKFEQQLLEASRETNSDKAVELYRQGLSFYKGDFLPNRLSEDWTAATRERLSALYLTGATGLARLLLKQENYVEVDLWCTRVIGADGLWEEAYRLLMRSHVQRGNRPLAVKTYRELAAKLDKELGLEPMQETRALYEEAMEK